jgi:hypothetical protein
MTTGKQGTEDLIVGKFGAIAGGRLFSLRFLAVPRERVMNGALNSRKKEAAQGGMTPLHVTPHVYESIWGFDPTDDRQSRLAIELVSPKRRRTVTLTPDQRAALAVRLATARQNRAQLAA